MTFYAVAVLSTDDVLLRNISTGIKANGINEAINSGNQILSDQRCEFETIKDNNK